MTSTPTQPVFSPGPSDAAGVLTWVHLGDLHMTKQGEQNDLDLLAIVDELNTVFVDTVNFVYLPGDIADDGSRAAYAVVRQSLDRLNIPWCAIVGDHDVHEKSFANFLEAMSSTTHYAFSVDNARFIAMNAFDIPDPGSFAVLPGQMLWVEQELIAATTASQTKVLLLHCYPSDLKMGGEQLAALVRKYQVLLIDMGHTHYNEIANDGHTVYTATRSTGQIEEGPVGFSVTNLDRGVLSWRFLELGQLPAVVITSPSDERLTADENGSFDGRRKSITVRAKIWGRGEIQHVHASIGKQESQLQRVPDSAVWEGVVDIAGLSDGMHPLVVRAEDREGQASEDRIHLYIGKRPSLAFMRSEKDQDNAVGAWPEHGLLGTQLGPNKNGRKW
jgi:3',5'-cyclic-AMP phosphodiesterase